MAGSIDRRALGGAAGQCGLLVPALNNRQRDKNAACPRGLT